MNAIRTPKNRDQEPLRRPFLTPQQMSEAAGVQRVTIYAWIRKGWIEVERGGPGSKSSIYIPVAEANRVLSELSLPTVDEAGTVPD